MKTARGRSVAIDLARVIAIVAVVTRHTWYDPAGTVAKVVCPWQIAIFFVLSGYLWTPGRDLGRDTRDRAKRLLIPYAAWTVLVSIPFFLWAIPHRGLATSIHLLADVVYGGGHAHIPFSSQWFFTALFFTAFYTRWLERYPRRVMWIVVGISVAISATVPLLLWFSPLGFMLALPCLLFVVLGQEFTRLRPRITRPIPVGLAAIGVGAIAILLGSSYDLDGHIIEIKAAQFGYPVAGLLVGSVISIGIILLCEGIEPAIPERVGAAVTAVAATSIFVMLLHPFVLFLIGTTWQGGWAHFLLAFFIPCGLALACIRRGILPWLTGIWPTRTAVPRPTP